jgi:hypothetical protein
LRQEARKRRIISNTDVTDAGMSHLKGLTKLSALYLSQTQLSDTGLAHLKGLTNLSSLDLSYTQVTDSGLPHLKALTNLSGLSLSDTSVTDAGLAQLKELGSHGPSVGCPVEGAVMHFVGRVSGPAAVALKVRPRPRAPLRPSWSPPRRSTGRVRGESRSRSTAGTV